MIPFSVAVVLYCMKPGDTGYFIQQPVPAPVEHVIEIRTKREDVQPVNSLNCPTSYEFIPMHSACPVTGMMSTCDAFIPALCERVTKSLWIDGQKIGVIREVEDVH